jgi:tetratricopeptide (TPR) repeat protein
LCFADPTSKCLFDEASQSATAIFKSELRDWALSEILVAEAKSGMVSKAMETVRLIEDPRLVIVALRDIATAQASAGRSVDTLAAADIIPDVAKRLEALTAIATIQAKKGNLKGPQKTARLLLEGLAKIEDGLKRISLATGAISILTKAGESEAAEKELFKIRIMVNAEEDSAHSSAALRHLASALVELGRPEQALALLSELPDASENTPVLISAAAAQAEAGHAKQAISTAHTIEAVRYRAVILSRIALAQTKAGDRTGGRQTVETALQAASPTLTNV